MTDLPLSKTISTQRTAFETSRTEKMSRLRIHRFDGWPGAVDLALTRLPAESLDWPHELYRALALKAAQHTRVRTYLCSNQRGDPELVLALAKGPRRTWHPVTQWIVPGFVAVGSRRRLSEALAALRCKASVAWWRMGVAPPKRGNIRRLRFEPTYGMNLQDGFDRFWSRNLRKTLSKARLRCAPFEFVVNAPGAAEYTIRASAEQWPGEEPYSTLETEARVLFAKMMEPYHRYHTFSLMDGDKYVVSMTACIHKADLTALVTARDRSYDRFNAGNYLLARIARWACEQGLRVMDIGGSYDYKERWGPAQSTKGKLYIESAPRYAANMAARPLIAAYHGGVHLVTFLISLF